MQIGGKDKNKVVLANTGTLGILSSCFLHRVCSKVGCAQSPLKTNIMSSLGLFGRDVNGKANCSLFLFLKAET